MNIGDEEVDNQEENELLKRSIQKERKMAFNAYNLLKMEVDYIGNFFFGKKKKNEGKEDTKKESEKNNFSEEEEADNEEEDDEEEDDEEEMEEPEEDYTLSKFYQSNTREELQNQLKNINFEDEDEEEEKETGEKENSAKEDLLSGSEDEKETEKETEKIGGKFIYLVIFILFKIS